MKKLLTFMVVVLAVPAVAMAAKSMAVTSGSASYVAVPQGTLTIPIEWSVTSDDTSINACGGSVYGPAGLTISGITLGTLFGTWSTFGSGDLANGDALTSGTEWGRYNTSDPSNLPATTTTLLTATINGVDTLAVGVYNLTLADSAYNPTGGYAWYTNAASGGDPVAFDSIGNLTLEITPEPATMLLLVGAIPFLRRRTA